ncbi:CLUMA_CG012510, isoform A [Clunio marinus]|uniref:CLUMA_CG012510, isoform A n=1 Tax=Clunio marinus TaxID=568069 RepID=A0A1J1IL46_9DIPT|nr:CLUMA_CG012510, isoform A [Clunio marinus]
MFFSTHTIYGNQLIQGILLTQAQLVSSSRKDEGETKEIGDPVLDLCFDISNRLPLCFDEKAAAVKYPVEYTNSMNTVLRQELIRFNRLLTFIKESLNDTRRAIIGQLAMIPELEKIHKAMSIGAMPEAWAKKSYPSLKPLGSYINDFIARLNFFQRWLDEGEPTVYWLGGFYFTQSFLTGVLQNHSRKNHLQIDHLHMKFDVTDFELEVQEQPEIGVYLKGIFLEGARWNRTEKKLDEAWPKILFDTLPVVTMTPMMKSLELLDEKESNYNCPMYRTTERRGVLATTGHSSNFVMFIQLNTDKSSNHWLNRSTASVLSLNH